MHKTAQRFAECGRSITGVGMGVWTKGLAIRDWRLRTKRAAERPASIASAESPNLQSLIRRGRPLFRNLDAGTLRNHARHRQRFERGTDDMRGPRAIRVVGGFGFEEFRVRQNHAELVVQAVKQCVEVRAGHAYEIVRHGQGGEAKARMHETPAPG